MISAGIPANRSQWQRKSFATSNAVAVIVMGIKRAYLVKRSTMTRSASNPSGVVGKAVLVWCVRSRSRYDILQGHTTQVLRSFSMSRFKVAQ
mmetsp:Transcript_5841/g.8243  ORF Transcript_5841/g.8243 Transcript_5841/m.8243 type:complete len:92 (-) Transcript_5841:36-311(-)